MTSHIFGEREKETILTYVLHINTERQRSLDESVLVIRLILETDETLC